MTTSCGWIVILERLIDIGVFVVTSVTIYCRYSWLSYDGYFMSDICFYIGLRCGQHMIYYIEKLDNTFGYPQSSKN